MHRFHAITPIILVFYEWRPEKSANHGITTIAGSASSIDEKQWFYIISIETSII